jgi:hypothetical protein
VQDALPLLRELLGIPAGRVMSAALVERDPRFASVRAALRGDTRR